MATTTTTETKIEAMPYSESDKLGPLGAKISALEDPAELRSALLREFHEAVQTAKQAVAAVDRSSTEAVHGARKGLRRARAVLELLEGALPKSERRAVGKALQEARRALSVSRDHAVAPQTLAGLPLGDEDRATAKRVLDNAAEALPAVQEIKQLLAESAARAAAQGEALEAALPAEITFETLLDGIRGVYSEARHAHGASKRSKQWFHTWRRRSKELAYQLDIVCAHAGPRVHAIHSELEGLTDTLGPAVDLVMVREYVTTFSQGVGADELANLKCAIDAQLDDLMKATRKAGRDTFEQKPKKFAKRIAKAIKRDLAPPDDHDHHDHNGDAS
ncbi:MAG: CHAD domain-containing protein [Deltaproteobacteria bacterium]|nr:CHAD domain-containing protein [Deltaproteobacteria bacterium]